MNFEIPDIPESLRAYQARIVNFVELSNNLIVEIKSHKNNLMIFYKEINEFGMNKVIFDASCTFKTATNLFNDISEFRKFIPFHLKFDFDKFLSIYQTIFNKEKLKYLEIETRINSLLKNMSAVPCSNLRDNSNTLNSAEYTGNDFLFDQDNEADTDDVSSEILQNVTNIGNKIEIIDSMFVQMSSMTENSKFLVDRIEENINNSDELTYIATKNLISASKYKAALIPIGSSLLGALIGGPIGLCIGLKAGLASGAIGAACGIVGGNLVKNYQQKSIENSEKHLESLK